MAAMSLFKYLGLDSSASQTVTTPTATEADTMSRIAAKLDTLHEKKANYVAAFAYILGRVAHADSVFSEAETSKMQEIVQDLGHLPEAQAVLVVEIAKNQVQLFGGTENFLITRRFKDMTSQEQRTELLDCIFAVSAADESISVLEEGQAGQIAKELGLSHDDFVNARLTYREHLETLKQLRSNH